MEPRRTGPEPGVELGDNRFDAFGAGEAQIPRRAGAEVVDEIGLGLFFPPPQIGDIATQSPQRVVGGLDLEREASVGQHERAMVVEEDFHNGWKGITVEGSEATKWSKLKEAVRGNG
jgi:hypothetical protein